MVKYIFIKFKSIISDFRGNDKNLLDPLSNIDKLNESFSDMEDTYLEYSDSSSFNMFCGHTIWDKESQDMSLEIE